MAQILPPKTNLGTQIGSAIGAGFAQGAGRANEAGFERGMLQKALKSLDDLPPGASAFDVTKHLLSATAGLKDQGRVLQALTPFVQSRLQAQQATGGPVAGQPSLGNAPTPQGLSLPIPLPPPQENTGAGFDNIGMGVGEMPATYSQDQYKQVNQQYLSAGLDPSHAINEMQRQDQIARERFVDIEKAATRQAQFSEELKSKHPNWSDQDLTVAERLSLSPNLRAIKNDTLRANLVGKQVQLYQAAKDNLRKGSERKTYDTLEHDAQVKNLSHYAKTMVDAGQRDEAERMLAENDWGPVEIQTILNPLPEKVRQGFKNLPKPRGVLEQVNVLPDDPQFDQKSAQAFQNRRNDLGKYRDFIEKNFQTGSYDPVNGIKPGTSLLQMRDEAMQNGVTFREFEQVVNSLVSEGKIKLDQSQQREHPLLAQHPATSFGIGEILWQMNPFYIPRK